MKVYRLHLIKLVHTLIWAFFASLIFYILYAGIFGKITWFTWVAISFVLLEVFTLLLFQWRCPLTLVARKYSDSSRENFDIYLPEWLAKNNKTIFSIIFCAGLILVFIRMYLPGLLH